MEQKKVALITGANTGIGRATAEKLAEHGMAVVLLCRSLERANKAREEIMSITGYQQVETLICDLSSMADVRRAAEQFKKTHSRLDVLINNAGVFLPKREESKEGIEKTFATNYLSHFLLTHLLLDMLKASAPSRIINVASKTGGAKIPFDDLMLKKGYSVMKAVPPSKLAQLYFTQELSKQLVGTGVTINALHPGLVKTPLLDDMPWLIRKIFHAFSAPPEKGARTSFFLATSPEVEGTTGKFFANCKEIPYQKNEADSQSAKRLWDISVKLVA